MNKKNCFESG